MSDAADAKPVILVVDTTSTAVVDALRHRYAADYDVVDATDAPADGLDDLHRGGRRVALVLADASFADARGDTDAGLFLRTRALFPDARRAMLLSWGEWAESAVEERVLVLMSELQIDYYVVRPHRVGDESFHRTITGFLGEWQVASGDRRRYTIIGEEVAPRPHVLAASLSRAGLGVVRVRPDSPDAQRILAETGLTYTGAPIVHTADGDALVDPDDAELMRSLGLTTELPSDRVDLAIVGAGPGGLAAAVYAASEGLSTLVLEAQSVGGQAGSSSLIRNYLGFPRGVSGSELAGRAYQQAWAFGARFAHTRHVARLEVDDEFVITTDDGGRVRAHSVVAATGVSYRRLAVPALKPFVGGSVFYGASSVEAQAQRDRPVCVVGGGNSAGQAALHLARYAASVVLVVRGPRLADSMSAYLIEQLDAVGVTVLPRSRVVDACGDGAGRLATIVLEDTETGGRHERECQGLFITIGARPHTEWLPDAVLRDPWGFVFTGSSEADEDAPEPWRGRAIPGPLETSLAGVVAVGDTRRSSVKRVASAVGEGSVVISSVHRFLATRRV
jgi:thioredoxin reductase